jgi:hypothetical protein
MRIVYACEERPGEVEGAFDSPKAEFGSSESRVFPLSVADRFDARIASNGLRHGG